MLVDTFTISLKTLQFTYSYFIDVIHVLNEHKWVFLGKLGLEMSLNEVKFIIREDEQA